MAAAEIPTTMIETKPPLKYRHELKYSISHREDRLLSSRLGVMFPRDKNAGPQGTYRVSSLYFDTPDEKALRQKINGVNMREKFRLRFYGETPNFFRLEKKMKRDKLCAKQSARLTYEQAELLIRGEYDFLRDSGDPLLVEFYSKLTGQVLRPQTIVVYDREAFVYAPGNVRVTLDRKLRTALRCTDFLNPSRVNIDISDGSSVLEVKYDAFLPDTVRMAVQTDYQRAAAISKYAVCRKYD